MTQARRKTPRSTGARTIPNPPSALGRIPVLAVSPVVDGGRWPAKAVVSEQVPIGATVFREGHAAVGATAVLIAPDGQERARIRMAETSPGLDRFEAVVRPDSPGDWTFRVEGWADPYRTWEHDAAVKIAAEVDVDLMLVEGAMILERALDQDERTPYDRQVLQEALLALRDDGLPPRTRLAAATKPELQAVLDRVPLRDLVTSSAAHHLRVHRERALVSSWYEMFPRSEGAHRDPETGRWVSGTFTTAARRLPAIAAMGFDVVYLPPIHPIGRVNRKGANNTLNPTADDPGSPWAIGSTEGGHTAIHPDLGSSADFTEFVRTARDLGLEVALDLALQCAPDHPWVTEHPEWFATRADGSIAYAENPPKKYQDIYPLSFDTDPDGLHRAILDVIEHWIGHGVTLFRVDNPHTKPVEFWEQLLAEVNAAHPEVIFLAEAFTRPAMMHTLAKIGFHQSYTYFTWRNSRQELTEYLTELTGEAAAYMRPNFWPNTPDILHEYLQYGGPAAFKIRALLAATTSPSWGIYSGFELCEHVAVRQGGEEYLDSEKYQFRPRDWALYEEGGPQAGRSVQGYLRRLNEIRREHPALRRLRNLKFHAVDDDSFLCYSRRIPASDSSDGREDSLLVVVTLDPHGPRESTVHLDMPSLGLDWSDTVTVHDLMTGHTFRWGHHNYVRLDPHHHPAHVLHVRRI
jgi:starch synthase (maltosyl-transferring)